ncbi:hypothetical protein, partial [Flavobacterium sp.]|uniref:hypothetical protein n=1 Tax=Flavobacterium sp. TaxID=239 RepID=UPI0037BE344A
MSLLIGNVFTADAQVFKTATQRTSSYTPDKKIYNIKGDFTIIGNTNLTLQSYGDDTTNANPMVYVDVDSDPNTLNSSSSTLALSNENGALPECSKIIFAGLYWTGRASDSNPSNNTFTVTKGCVTKNYDKTKISLKGPGQSSYTTFTANPNDIYYPTTSQGYMYAAYAEVTDYVRANGVGAYFAADMALIEGNGGGTGFYGGWSLIVVYENSKMKYRDVTIFDGYAYVAGSVTASFELPVSGFNTVQAGPVAMKLGLISGEGDRGISGDFFQIKKQSDGTFMDLSHSGNSTGNFFNSSIQTGGNTRNPNLLNNTGLDVSMFNIPNTSNQVITNNQTSTTFKFGSTQDTYIIFAIAMAVDAYTPVVEDLIVGGSVNGVPVSGPIASVLPGDEIGIKINIYNKGTEAINNTKHIIPIPYMVDFVPGSLTKNVNFSPLPSPNNYYFDPSLGPKGSIVYDFGTLPLPSNPDTILADFSFKVKVTTDCSILKNAACGQSISISGTISGIGAITGVDFHNKPLIIGHTSTGMCTGEPILNPLTIPVNATAYVYQNCQSTPAIRDFVFCNPGTTIPITAINSGFPPGSRFYNLAGTTEYTISNPFPATSGAVQYYALPPDAAIGCNFPFTITVTKVTTKPITAATIAYCQGATALPLTATPTVNNPPYTLYYFTSETGTPQLSITPSTATVGSITYWVAEAASGTCIGPKVPIVVTVNPLPDMPLVSAVTQPTCSVASGSFTITNYNASYTYTFSPSVGVVNNAGTVTAPAGTYTMTTTLGACSAGPCANIVINVQPAIPAEPAKINCWDTFTFNTETCLWVNNNTPKPVEPTKVNCWDIFTFNTSTCVWDVTGTQPVKPSVLCYETATWNPATCIWDVTGTQPVKPSVL